jgi:hypothetical protein
VLVTSATLEGTATSADLARAGSNDGHVGLWLLYLWDVVRGRVLSSLDGVLVGG